MPQNFMNVKEQWFLYDTVAVSPWVDTLSHPIPGWYNSFASLGNDSSISFFTSRNKSIGLAYNNQESRDQVPYALIADSISVFFISPACSSQLGSLDQGTYRGRIDTMSAFWACEMPQHSSFIFRTNQDERLKMNCMMAPPGYGDVGSSMGQGNISAQGGIGGSVSPVGTGRSHMKFRWEFPTGIGIPRRATIGVDLQLVEWARTALQTVWGPGNNEFYTTQDDGSTWTKVYKYSMFMIQVLITGRREVQQRGQYHA